jgi:hypothetical protein
MPLTIIGYIGYTILIFFAVTWIIGVRIKYDACYWTIFGSLLFTVVSIILPLLKINFLHTLWIIPSIFLIIRTIPYIFIHNIPIIKNFIKKSASIYVNIIRIGIDKDMLISKVRELDKEFIENWASEKDLDEKIKLQLPRLSFSEIDENLKLTLENVKRFKNSLPSYFNQLVVISYLYEFVNISAMGISKDRKQHKKYIKKILFSLFGRKEGGNIILLANMKKNDEFYLIGKRFAQLDIELIETGNDPMYLLKYYKGEISQAGCD